MSKQSREEYYDILKRRYRSSDKETKSQLLDEFCKICGYNRKYSIRKLNALKKLLPKISKFHPGIQLFGVANLNTWKEQIKD